MHRRSLTLETPCTADWDAMLPLERGHLCRDCDKVVHDLSGMKERDAQALLAARPTEGLCVRYLYDAHGMVVFDNAAARIEPEQIIPEHRLTARLKRRLVQASVLAAPMFIQACGGNPGTPRDAMSMSHGYEDDSVPSVHEGVGLVLRDAHRSPDGARLTATLVLYNGSTEPITIQGSTLRIALDERSGLRAPAARVAQFSAPESFVIQQGQELALPCVMQLSGMPIEAEAGTLAFETSRPLSYSVAFRAELAFEGTELATPWVPIPNR
jgi:hypothetical protein